MTGFLVLDGRQRNFYLRRLQWDIHLWFFSGLPTEVKDACVHVAESEEFVVINNRCSKLGEWAEIIQKFPKGGAGIEIGNAS